MDASRKIQDGIHGLSLDHKFNVSRNLGTHQYGSLAIYLLFGRPVAGVSPEDTLALTMTRRIRNLKGRDSPLESSLPFG